MTFQESLNIENLDLSSLYNIQHQIQRKLGVDPTSILSEDIMANIAKYLNYQQLCKTQRISKRWKEIFSKRSIYQTMVGKLRNENSSKHCEIHCPNGVFDWKLLAADRWMLKSNWKYGSSSLTRFAFHTDTVYCITTSDKFIITGSRDKTILILNFEFDIQVSLHGHRGSVLCLDNNGHFLVSGSSDNTVILWDLTKFEEVRRYIGHHEPVLCVQIHGQHIISASKDHTIKCWNISTESLIHDIRIHTGSINSFKAVGDILISGSTDRTIGIFSISQGRLLTKIEGLERSVACIDFDGKRIVAGSSNGIVRCWEYQSHRLLVCLDAHSNLTSRCIKLKNNRIISGGYDGALTIVDLERRAVERVIRYSENNNLLRMFSVTMDDRFIFATCEQLLLRYNFSHNIPCSDCIV